MKQNKVYYFNFNVGSGIEFTGNTIKPWIEEFCKENDYVFYERKDQGQGYEQYSDLVEQKPNVIVLNEYYDKSVEASLFYKIANPNTKIIFINHVYTDLDWAFSSTKENDAKVLEQSRLREFLQKCDLIYVVNKKPTDSFPKQIAGKIHNFYQPTNPQMFKIKMPWEERQDNFLYLGNILPHKLSAQFLQEIDNYDIVLNCVGNKNHANESYKLLFDSRKNICYHGFIPQEDVPNKLNTAKYFILPHDGYEPFNMALLQAMFCGSIPIIVNRCNEDKDRHWLDWAQGLYFEAKNYTDLLQIMANISIFEKQYDMPALSKYISQTAQEKFSYIQFKEHFTNNLKTLIEV